MQDLKPAVFAQNLPANNLIRFSEDFGGETNLYQGYDVNIEGRFRNGAFLKAGIGARSRRSTTATSAAGRSRRRPRRDDACRPRAPRSYPDGTSACHREYPFRPDAKVSGSYMLPYGAS